MNNPSSSGMAKKLRALETCPVTGGLPTAMTLDGFTSACTLIREQAKPSSWDKRCYKQTWCDTCQGKKLPKELRVLSLEKLKKQRVLSQYMKSREMRQHSPAR